MEEGARKVVEENGEATAADRPAGLPGATLRAAREAAGMSIEVAAESLRLHGAQIEAIEADDAGHFSAPIFYHGFLRSYARLLGLDPAPLLAAVRAAEPAAAPPLTAERTGAARVRRRRLATDFAGTALIAAVFLVGIGVLWTMTRGTDPVPEAPVAATPAETAPPVQAPPAGAPPAGAEDAGGGTLAVTEVPASAAAPASGTASASGAAPGAASAPVAGAAEPEAGSDRIVLRFSGRSWVEISDADGRRLAVRMGEAGETLALRGNAPFDILLGNAPNVTLEYNGSPYTDIPANRQNVANFRLGPERE